MVYRLVIDRIETAAYFRDKRTILAVNESSILMPLSKKEIECFYEIVELIYENYSGIYATNFTSKLANIKNPMQYIKVNVELRAFLSHPECRMLEPYKSALERKLYIRTKKKFYQFAELANFTLKYKILRRLGFSRNLRRYIMEFVLEPYYFKNNRVQFALKYI